MSTAMLRDTFQNLLEPAKQMQAQYLPQIRQQAETLDMGRVMDMVVRLNPPRSVSVWL
jgi:hypothetical protein